MSNLLKSLPSSSCLSSSKNFIGIYNVSMDAALRVGTPTVMDPGMDYSAGNKRKRGVVNGPMGLRNGVPLAFVGLPFSGSLSVGNGDSTVASTVANVGGEGSPSEVNLDFSLNIGSKSLYKECENSNAALPALKLGRPNVNLELSLSTGCSESDITCLSVQNILELPIESNLAQLVDDGRTLSEWTGSFLPMLSGMQNVKSGIFYFEQNVVDGISSSPQSTFVPPISSSGDAIATSHPKKQRKSSVKPCQHPGCLKGARGASGRCISHGGGRRCIHPDCEKGAEGKLGFCKAHGGGRRCQVLECTKSADGRTNFCISHGGGTRCGFPEGCSHAARGKSGFCIRHGGGKRCKVENCARGAEGKEGKCIAHGGGRRCQYADCKRGAQGSTKFCKAHGGGKRCTYLGCIKGAEGSTLLCKGHGGGKRCSFQGEGGGACTKSVHGGTWYCVAHGGGKRCAMPECTKSARGRTSYCVRHGGGKRCKFEGCIHSAQGKTDYCKMHGGGKRCAWGQLCSDLCGYGAMPCEKFARGRLGLCAAHAAQIQDERVHGNGTVGVMLNDPSVLEKMKGKGIVREPTPTGGMNTVTGEGRSSSYFSSMQFLPNDVNLLEQQSGSVPEGRVHGGGLMALLSGHAGFASTSSVPLLGGLSEEPRAGGSR